MFKSTRAIANGLAGAQDMDILVHREDYTRFCEILSSFHGRRGIAHDMLTSIGREDWFIPDFACSRYLHLDLHIEVRLGGKFNKRYPAFRYGDITEWVSRDHDGCSVPQSSSMDEARTTLSRIAFRQFRWPWQSWAMLKGDWAEEIHEILFPNGAPDECVVRYEQLSGTPGCTCRLHNGKVVIAVSDINRLRRLLRNRGGGTSLRAMADVVINTLKACRYFSGRLWVKMFPGSYLDRRRMANGGLLVAVMAPDGLGKSTQTARLQNIFAWKFCTITAYMGTGDGKGWWLRRLIIKFYSKNRSKIRELAQLTEKNQSAGARETSGPPSLRRKLVATALSIWGLLVALERYFKVRKSRQMANRGYIVIADRWPQALQAGYHDGPVALEKDNLFWGCSWIRKMEIALYHHMNNFTPDLFLHMIADYATSEKRKPGELTEEAFSKRAELMTRIRKATQNCVSIDASRSIDMVTSELFTSIWKRF